MNDFGGVVTFYTQYDEVNVQEEYEKAKPSIRLKIQPRFAILASSVDGGMCQFSLRGG